MSLPNQAAAAKSIAPSPPTGWKLFTAAAPENWLALGETALGAADVNVVAAPDAADVKEVSLCEAEEDSGADEAAEVLSAEDTEAEVEAGTDDDSAAEEAAVEELPPADEGMATVIGCPA
ncbi:MAG: hypothetical protein Q9160_003044 [Pyrenula sp. 1 TL-2023]